jgi:hypothetical protein
MVNVPPPLLHLLWLSVVASSFKTAAGKVATV